MRSSRRLPQADSSSIGVSDLVKVFDGTHALAGLSLKVQPGQLVCLLGPSGCGKTTLLRCIAGLERPSGGSISVGGTIVEDPSQGTFVAPERRGLGMVFQHYALWPHMTVRQNIEYPLRRMGIHKKDRLPKVLAVAELVGLEALLDRRPHQLSGGQQQRVALARAVARQPRGLLLDEPLSNLDTNLRKQLRMEVRQLHDELNMTMVYVTHDQEEAAALADVIVVMDAGRIVQIGSPEEILERPLTSFVAGFVGFENFLSGRVVETGASHSLVQLEGNHLVLAVRGPEDLVTSGAAVVVAAKSQNSKLCRMGLLQDSEPMRKVAGTIIGITPLGNRSEVQVLWEGGVLTVGESGTKEKWHVGDQVAVELDPDSAVVVRGSKKTTYPQVQKETERVDHEA